MGEDVVITPEPGSTPEGSTSDGRQRGRQNPCRAFNKPVSTPVAPRLAKFKGQCDELKGNLYDCSNTRHAADEFTWKERKMKDLLQTLRDG